MEIGYDYANIKFTTHAIKGLSANDFICAAKVDSLAVG
jgi:4a-hydroxytetrahydrobiopterin dehydratase